MQLNFLFTGAVALHLTTRIHGAAHGEIRTVGWCDALALRLRLVGWAQDLTLFICTRRLEYFSNCHLCLAHEGGPSGGSRALRDQVQLLA